MLLRPFAKPKFTDGTGPCSEERVPEISLSGALEDATLEVVFFGFGAGLEIVVLLLEVEFLGPVFVIGVEDVALLRLCLLNTTVEGGLDSDFFLFIVGIANWSSRLATLIRISQTYDS